MALKLVSPIESPTFVIENNGEGSIFHQPWWLQASGGDALEYVTTEWDGKTVGSLAFVRRRQFGLRLLNMPPYTHTQGPVLNLPPSKPAKAARNLRRVVRELVEKLPAHDRFHLFLDPDDPSAFPFALAGCMITQDFTFRLPRNQNLATHWDELDQKTRNLVRTAGKALQLKRTAAIEPFLEMCVRERGKQNRHNMIALRRMGEIAAKHGQLMVMMAEDERGRVAASCVLLWDDAVVYYWQSSRDPELNHPGANNLLVWESMKFAAQNGRIFDMDGYATPTSARFGAKFSMQPVVRASVAHMSHIGHLLHALTSRPGSVTE